MRLRLLASPEGWNGWWRGDSGKREAGGKRGAGPSGLEAAPVGSHAATYVWYEQKLEFLLPSVQCACSPGATKDPETRKRERDVRWVLRAAINRRGVGARAGLQE
jgi:hypothetical protein